MIEAREMAARPISLVAVTAFILIVAGLLHGPEAIAQTETLYGQFLSRPRVELLADNRNVRLTEDFTFRDRSGTFWTAPSGTVTDGASIPGALQPFVGTPFVGEHRDAAIIHDHYCQVRTVDSEKVHEIFFYGLLASGMNRKKAEWFYWAVRWGGSELDGPARHLRRERGRLTTEQTLVRD